MVGRPHSSRQPQLMVDRQHKLNPMGCLKKGRATLEGEEVALRRIRGKREVNRIKIHCMEFLKFNKLLS